MKSIGMILTAVLMNFAGRLIAALGVGFITYIRTQKEQKRQTRCKNNSRILRREEPQTQNMETEKPNGKGAPKHHTLHSKTEATKSIRNSQKANRIR